MTTKRILLTLVLGSWMAAGSLAYGQYGTPSGTQANTASDVTIPAGAGVSVRTNEAIDSRNASDSWCSSDRPSGNASDSTCRASCARKAQVNKEGYRTDHVCAAALRESHSKRTDRA